MRWAIVLAVLGMAVGAYPSAAKADERWDFIRFTCSPELRLFEATRINHTTLPYGDQLLNNQGRPRRAALTMLAITQGIYDMATLEEHPFRCDRPKRRGQ